MLVTILSFGCNWWRRFGNNAEDRFRFTKHAAVYNSTGIQCGKKIRRHWVIPGLIRFNGASNLAAAHRNRCIGQTFSCTEPVFALGGNRVVFQAKAANNTNPDCFLVVISSDRFGAIDFRSSQWKSEMTRAIAASQLRDKQETMLLMRVGDWVETSLGRWLLYARPDLDIGAALQLSEEC